MLLAYVCVVPTYGKWERAAVLMTGCGRSPLHISECIPAIRLYMPPPNEPGVQVISAQSAALQWHTS